MNKLQQKIESLLFYKNEPTKIKWLAKELNSNITEIKEELENMLSFYENRGVNLVFTDESASLLTAEISSGIISSLTKNDKEQDLSKQALETLSIILYKRKISKSELDYIRGVNSIFILRNLLIRGLIEKQTNPEDRRASLYIPTNDTLSFLGINKLDELPQYEIFSSKLGKMENEWVNENSTVVE